MSGLPAKNMYKSKFTGCKSIQPLRSVLGGSIFCSNDCYESFGGRSLPALYNEMVKSLPILHVKIALVLPSLMVIVDGLKSSSLAMNVQLGSSQDFGWGEPLKNIHLLLIQSLHRGFRFVLRIIVLLNVNLQPSFRFMADSSRFSSRILLDFAPPIVPSILTRLPVPVDEKVRSGQVWEHAPEQHVTASTFRR